MFKCDLDIQEYCQIVGANCPKTRLDIQRSLFPIPQGVLIPFSFIQQPPGSGITPTGEPNDHLKLRLCQMKNRMCWSIWKDDGQWEHLVANYWRQACGEPDVDDLIIKGRVLTILRSEDCKLKDRKRGLSCLRCNYATISASMNMMKWRDGPH